jgi:hypothetical protein
MTMHQITGMGAFDGFVSGLLHQQRAVKLARIAIADLPDAVFAEVVVEAIRARPAVLVERIIDGVVK